MYLIDVIYRKPNDHISGVYTNTYYFNGLNSLYGSLLTGVLVKFGANGADGVPPIFFKTM